jgi:hypothetical protein
MWRIVRNIGATELSALMWRIVRNIGAMELSALMWRIVRNIAAYFPHRQNKGSDLNLQLNRTREDDERHLSGQQRG